MVTEELTMADKKEKPWPFVKMQALGNDMVILDCRKSQPKSPMHTARKLCNRRYGVGADMLILLTNSRPADFGVKFFNSDGSEAETCGNGLRCVAVYLKEQKLISKKDVTLETKAGVKNLRLRGANNVELDMGEPMLKGKEIPVNLSGRIINRAVRLENKEFKVTCVGMGNPHCVVFQEDIVHFPVERFGPMLETFQIFPRKTNVSFVNVVSDKEIQMRVWERGVGETLSCGSGACAGAVAAVLNGYTARELTVVQPGGKLLVSWRKDNNHVILTGAAEKVFNGEIVL